ncbi:NYN domain-containing protein [Rathayibacter sp. YIM 133350]|uniref:NYN domain-containing protein n=1 Tax=Rathayibacter sp. YIM 133350 TaxID=3131992 RepID=UPI00307DFFAB
MNGTAEPRVAVYIDFDNIVISRYDQIHGRGSFSKDRARNASRPASATATGVAAVEGVPAKLAAATVDLGAVLDYASSFGDIAVCRAYADWSVPVNAGYRMQLIERAVDLVQLFPTTAAMKNGADIRLAVDVIEDLFRLPDLTHVVIVAGDSDYIALAQRAKVLGRYVIGIGVAGATSKALTAACNEFADYDALPSFSTEAADDDEPDAADGADSALDEADAAATDEEPEQPESPIVLESGLQPAFVQPSTAPRAAAQGPVQNKPSQKSAERTARKLLVRALELGEAKNDEEWQSSGVVKNQMQRMDPSFQERALGFSSFTDFVKAEGGLVELDETHPSRRIRLRRSGRQA